MHERESRVTYVSGLASYLEAFVAEKRALGYRYLASASILSRFDRFLVAHAVTSPDLSKPLVEAWIRKQPYESLSTRRDRIYVVRQFCLFLIRRGQAPYLPHTCLIPKGRSSFVPYVFTHEQIGRLLAAADQTPARLRSPRREIIYPLIFRLLYGCGLRVSEALRLQVRDVDLQRDLLTIRETKFGKDRLVPVALSLAARLRGYAVAHLQTTPLTAPFFPAPDGGRFHDQTIRDHFRRLLWICGISYRGRGHGPRLHDLRHTFAVHRLLRWYRDGVDLGVALPVLAAYLGHVSLRGTQRYLQLTAEMHPDLIAALYARHGEVIPHEELP